MRLVNLHPEWRAVVRDFIPETGGIDTGDCELMFDCPLHGSPYRVCIKVGPNSPDPTIPMWQWNCSPDGALWPDKLTIRPSIQMPHAMGHGHRKDCGWHGSVVNGEIVN